MPHLKSIVTSLLTHNIELRDNVNLLCVEVWKHSHKEFTSLDNFFERFTANRIHSVHSIARISRIVQETTPQLRGKNWGKRKSKVPKVQSDLRELKSFLLAC